MKNIAIYVRVSTDHQTVDNQLLELRKSAVRNDCVIVGEYVDKGVSGSYGRDRRPQWDNLLKAVNRKEFDCIYIWDISRAGRSMRDLIQFLEDIQSKDVDLYIHNSGIDTSTPTGKMMFSFLSVFAEFERSMIRSRVQSGMERAKTHGTKSGKKIGRPSNVNPSTEAAVIALRENGMSLNKIGRELGIGSGSIYKILEKAA
jgi:DNA invertase Pin-like site-specific DNA recombinase